MADDFFKTTLLFFYPNSIFSYKQKSITSVYWLKCMLILTVMKEIGYLEIILSNCFIDHFPIVSSGFVW